MKCFTKNIHRTGCTGNDAECSACNLLEIFKEKFTTEEEYVKLETLMGNVMTNAYVKGGKDGVDLMRDATLMALRGSKSSSGRPRSDSGGDTFFNIATCGIGALLP